MDPRSGFTTPNILEAETDRALIDAGRRLVLMADHTKWGVIGIASIGRLQEAHALITDAGLDPTAIGPLAAAVQRLIVVDVRTGERRIIDGDGAAAGYVGAIPGSTGDRA
jgi:DeoR/GlpR family transcriptional regulator of sugar metabolism